MTLIVLPRLKVVTGPDVPKPGTFGGPGLRHQLIGSELFVRQHDSNVPGRRGASRLAGRLAAGAAPGGYCARPSTPVPAASRANVRREIPVIGSDYPSRDLSHHRACLTLAGCDSRRRTGLRRARSCVEATDQHGRSGPPRRRLADPSTRPLVWAGDPQARPAHKADIRDLSRTLARAFYDDPVMTWLLPHDKSRLAHLHRVFAAMTRHHHLAHGGVEVACEGAGVGAAALWDPPNQWRETRRAELAMTPAFLRVFGFRGGTARAVQEAMKRAHPEEPHWYLAVIGSDPGVRGRGFGQALMRSRLDRCDAEYCPAYLESSKPENIPYYERFGFTVTGEIMLPRGGPPIWPMWREPR
ncbi:hypothetical protein NIIDMKKI_73260 [Mycobacterium kansasii]|uniref:N-acetyltransferase domain-containing protein n=1 Tax=Mycobacterium kansasii TaxID=1768 RepID=A0A7G1IMK8_MYCKA|nr:hypothetical protein NIIDMKKI_73260 [Mycobacterium kansasii]